WDGAPIPFHELNLPGFPSASLPEWQRNFVEAEARATQTPPDLAGVLVLTATALAVAKKCRILIKPGYFEPLNLYAAVAQPPAARKTQVFRDTIEPIEEWER